MSAARRAAAAAAMALGAGLTAPAAGCTLHLSDHRAGRELARLPLDPAAPALRVAFTHSVLGTPVEDRYAFRATADGWRAVLVEERWQGEGYGLPHAAGPGETLARDPSFGADGWRLTLHRPVHPLVVLALPSQRMRVLVDGQPPLLLGALGPPVPVSVALAVHDCPGPAAAASPRAPA